jgi:hypothetical protein
LSKTVGLSGALLAFAAAWSALGGVANGMVLALPFLVGPLSMVGVATLGWKRGQWWALLVSMAVSLILVAALLIPRNLAGDPMAWPGAFIAEFSKTVAALDPGERSRIGVALITYLVAVLGGKAAAK